MVLSEEPQDGDGQADDPGGLQPQRTVKVSAESGNLRLRLRTKLGHLRTKISQLHLRRERFEIGLGHVLADRVADRGDDSFGLGVVEPRLLESFRGLQCVKHRHARIVRCAAGLRQRSARCPTGLVPSAQQERDP